MGNTELEQRIAKLEGEGAEAKKQAELEKARAVGERESLLFLQRHLPGSPKPYLNVEANTRLITEWIKTNNLPWTLRSLEQAFEALGPKLAQPVLEPNEPTPAPAPSYPWGNQYDSKDKILKAEAKEYRDWYFSRKHGAAFREYVNAILEAGR